MQSFAGIGDLDRRPVENLVRIVVIHASREIAGNQLFDVCFRACPQLGEQRIDGRTLWLRLHRQAFRHLSSL